MFPLQLGWSGVVRTHSPAPAWHSISRNAVACSSTFPLLRRPTWQLKVRGSGLDPQAGAVTLVFNSWGGWREVDSLYIDVQACQPAVDADLFPGNALVLQAAENWDGSFEVDFAIHPLRAGSSAQERWGMLPTWSKDYSFGQSRNVFPQVYQDSGPVAASRKLSLHAPRGCSIASGWAGLSHTTQKLDLDPTVGNAFVAFGTPLAHQVRPLPEGRLEVVQYGRVQVVAAAVAELSSNLARSMGALLGAPHDPAVVFITDVGGGGMGADFGLVLGYTAETPDWQIESPYYFHFVAHEFFHQWLGSRLKGGESFTWFHEGFTEYFSLWHLAATGAVSRDWFAERLLELGTEAQQNSSWGSVAFADDDVNWRDGDGRNETMAYKGGAMLAFLLDVALREADQPGAHQLLRDLMDSGIQVATLEDLETWCAEHGLADFWQRYVAGTDVPDLGTWLLRIGYEKDDDDTRLRYRARGQALDTFFSWE